MKCPKDGQINLSPDWAAVQVQLSPLLTLCVLGPLYHPPPRFVCLWGLMPFLAHSGCCNRIGEMGWLTSCGISQSSVGWLTKIKVLAESLVKARLLTVSYRKGMAAPLGQFVKEPI